MKLYIPDIGDSLTLSKDWNFKVVHEYRNTTLLKSLDPNYKEIWRDAGKTTDCTLKAGTVLKVDRIYIRKGRDLADYSSVTFLIPSIKRGRFWAKLEDVNRIEFEENKVVESERTKQPKFKPVSHYEIRNYIYMENLKKKDLEILDKNIKEKTVFEVKEGQYKDDNKVFNENNPSKILKLKRNYTIKEYSQSTLGKFVQSTVKRTQVYFGLIGEDYYVYINVIYSLYDGNKKIGEWMSAKSMLDNAKKYLNETNS